MRERLGRRSCSRPVDSVEQTARSRPAFVGALFTCVVPWIVSAGCGGGSGSGFGGANDAAGNGGDAQGDAGVAADAPHPTLDSSGPLPSDAAGDRATGDGSALADSGPDAVTDATVPATDGAFDASLGFDSAGTDDGGGIPEIAIVYGHSATVLYSVNPNTKALTKVGNFSGCGDEVIDIALDKSSNMYATAASGVYTVDRTTAACHQLASGSYPNSLSFVPAGTLDPDVEALVGYEGSSYVRINTTTGALTTVGSLGNTYSSSGDIVSVIGGGTYLTVTGGSDCSNDDCLVQVNPKTGVLVTNYGSVQHSAVYGLAFWAGTVYGFDSAGSLFEVNFPDAGGLVVTSIAIPDPPLGLSFYGAGSTTAAPRTVQ